MKTLFKLLIALIVVGAIVAVAKHLLMGDCDGPVIDEDPEL